MKLPPFSERLVYYLLAPDLFSRVVLEAGLGMYWYTNVQPKLWVFYGLMSVEYAYFFSRIGRFRLAKGYNLLNIYILLILFIHGAVVGVLWGNSTSKIITDSIVIFVLLANVFILGTEGAFEGFNFQRVYRNMRIYAAIMILVGMVAVSLGKPSTVSLGGAAAGPLCLTILILGLAQGRRLSFGGMTFLLLVLAMIAPNMTRTALLALVIIMVFYLGPKIVRSAAALYLVAVFAVVTPFIIPMIIPDDSPVMNRIRGLTEDTTNEEGGSLGERQEEFRAINEKLHELGPQAEWFGYGSGGVYQPVFTNGVIPEGYSHAHYGWALFKLRYGYTGYVYLSIFGFLLVFNCLRLARRKDPVAQLVCLLGIWGILFIFTYFSFNFLIAGLQFCRPPMLQDTRRRNSVGMAESRMDEFVPSIRSFRTRI